MSTSAVLTILSLFSGHVLAQVYAPDYIQLAWSKSVYSLSVFNVNLLRGQSVIFLVHHTDIPSSPRTGFNLQALPQGYSYTGPTSDDNTTCKCSTVVYSLLSACDACQGQWWPDWYQYSPECTNGQPASSFPNPVPGGIRVPNWALIDITIEGNWDYSQSYTVGDLPEVLSGGMIKGVSTSSVVPSSTVAASTSSSISSSEPAVSSTSSPSSGSSNRGAIAWGVAGGLVAVSAAALILFFFLRRKRALVYDGALPPLTGQVQSPPLDDGAVVPPSLPTTPTTPIKLYDPNDRTTFPGYQGTVPAPGAYTEVPNMYTGSTLASTPSTRPLGYHGLPTV
ncbi:hypothetical protein BGW80DRAFT_1459437 [Lactifluus volemus]|nr:hypothetical protein BGW80DRAFT_1459437 [Lactifluus volemus]